MNKIDTDTCSICVRKNDGFMCDLPEDTTAVECIDKLCAEINRLKKRNLWLREIIQQIEKCVEAIRAMYLVGDVTDELLRKIQESLKKVKKGD